MAGSSANLGALNSEWSDLASKVANAFYFPGSDAQVAARRAQNGQDGSVLEQPVAAPPVVVGQTPAKPAVTPTVTPTVTPPVTAAPVAKAAPTVAAPPRGDYSDLNMPELSRFGASATQPVAAPVAPTIKAPTLNADLMQQRQDLMTQIAAAQGVVQAGSNRDGYKMGDVTKALATMNALSPLVNATGQLVANTYGTDAGVLTHSMDNTARVGIADAGNQTEIAKTQMVTAANAEGRAADAAAGIALANHKAALEAQSPSGAKALTDAQLGQLKLQSILNGDIGTVLALEGKQAARVESTNPINGRRVSVSTINPKGDTIDLQAADPEEVAKTKKGK